jgi:peptide/nickel transport system substrate-binding protein
MAYALYDTLTAFDPKAFAAGQALIPQPSLAKSWTVDSTGKIYTFTIRDGIKFANGKPLTSASIKASFERALKVAQLAKLTTRYPILTKMTTIDAPNPTTLVVTLDDVFAPFLATLAAPNYGIVDVEETAKHVTGDDQGQGWLKANSAGSGPWALEEFIPEQRVVFKANPNYWGGFDGVKPSVDRIIQLNIPEAATRQLMLGRGEVDLVHTLDATQLKSLGTNADVAVVVGRTATTINFIADLRIPQLKDVRVRQALRYAIDYDAMKNVIAGGYGEIQQSNILPGMPGYDQATSTFYKYDPAKAKQLLADAGLANGFDLPLISRDGGSGTVIYSKAITLWQQNLADIKVNAKITEMTSASMAGLWVASKLNAVSVSGAGATVFDPDNPASIRAVQEATLLGWAEVDPDAAKQAADLTAQGAKELDPAKRATIYAQISKLLVERSPYWTFLQTVEPVATRKTIGGITFTPSAFPIDWKYLTKQ